MTFGNDLPSDMLSGNIGRPIDFGYGIRLCHDLKTGAANANANANANVLCPMLDCAVSSQPSTLCKS